MDPSADTLTPDPLTNSQLSHLAKIKDIVTGITRRDQEALTASELHNLAEITAIVARLEHGACRCRLVRRAGRTPAPLAVTTNLAPQIRSSSLVRRVTMEATAKYETHQWLLPFLSVHVCPLVSAHLWILDWRVGATHINTTLDSSLVKKWLLLQAYSAHWKLPAEPLAKEHVLCMVSRRYSKATRQHTLSIYTFISLDLSLSSDVTTSPIAVLDTYIGDCNDAAAPGWLRWDYISVSFQHDRAGFIGLFVNLVLWAENLGMPELSSEMIQWAWAISVGTWAEFLQLGPSTPHKPTAPSNHTPYRRYLLDAFSMRRLFNVSPIRHLDTDFNTSLDTESDDEDFPDSPLEDYFTAYNFEPLPALFTHQ
ncbi:hypothetical protein B0H16DRAFT_1721166 [Mycena metata]|uniref:Uncharacterized protein n=1 Tax=Mycena metata TaxID=1033252 RepID=A0AAD7JAD5_9AGAR|nr:hypothetical protein B0H16DRAFT_1721166 [Mycena metata]